MELTTEIRLEHRASPVRILLGELLPLPSADLDRRVAAELDANPALELPPGAHQPVEPRAADDPRARWIAEARLTSGDRVLARYLLDDVNEYGVLVEPLGAIAVRLGVAEDALDRVIRALRSNSPGICAESLERRLLLEAEAAGPVPAAVRAMLTGGPPTANATGWLRANVHLETFERTGARHTVDVVVDRDLAVHLPPPPWAGLQVADSYLAAAADPAVNHEIARAQRFLLALNRREHTLHRITEAVVRHQRRRMLTGPRAHRPLTRHAVAAEVGLHESTVGRAISGKHVRLPTGETIPFAALFGGSRGIKECLRELAADGPLPDVALQRALAGHGHHVSRRAVAKYRAELGIPSSRTRVRRPG